jgi:hypothetical protein
MCGIDYFGEGDLMLPKEKIYLCRIKGDKSGRTWFATSSYIGRYMVLYYGIWGSYFQHELEDVRLAKITESEKTTTEPTKCE